MTLFCAERLWLNIAVPSLELFITCTHTCLSAYRSIKAYQKQHRDNNFYANIIIIAQTYKLKCFEYLEQYFFVFMTWLSALILHCYYRGNDGGGVFIVSWYPCLLIGNVLIE